MGGSASYRYGKKIANARNSGASEEEIKELERQREEAIVREKARKAERQAQKNVQKNTRRRKQVPKEIMTKIMDKVRHRFDGNPFVIENVAPTRKLGTGGVIGRKNQRQKNLKRIRRRNEDKPRNYTDEEIKKLLKNGFSRWTKTIDGKEYDRLYLNDLTPGKSFVDIKIKLRKLIV